MRGVPIFALMLAGCVPDGPPYFIPGTAELPACQDAAATDLSGAWYDNGEVEITSPGCEDTMVGDRITVCGLDWKISQSGNDVAIEVDGEYEIKGRLCGDQLHLEGGWWISVDLEGTGCTYEDGVEVGIDAEASTLMLAEDGTVEGVLAIRSGCTARYDMVLRRKP
jgi:hypothetical protein